jgi:hypothetical protein
LEHGNNTGHAITPVLCHGIVLYVSPVSVPCSTSILVAKFGHTHLVAGRPYWRRPIMPLRWRCCSRGSSLLDSGHHGRVCHGVGLHARTRCAGADRVGGRVLEDAAMLRIPCCWPHWGCTTHGWCVTIALNTRRHGSTDPMAHRQAAARSQRWSRSGSETTRNGAQRGYCDGTIGNILMFTTSALLQSRSWGCDVIH